MDGQKVLSGYSDIPFNIDNNTFAVEGFEFVCWNTKADGTGTNIYPNDSVFFQTDTALYAQWKFLYKIMNLVEIGDVDIQSNIATKFNVNSGLRTPQCFEWTNSNSFELVFKIITGDDVTTKQILFRLSDAYKMNLCLSDGKLLVEYNNTTSSATFMTNTVYYIKVVKNGTQIDVYRSIDNVNFERVLTTAIPFISITQYFVFGQNYQYTYSYKENYPVEEDRTETTYTYEYRWITKNGCAYANKNGRTYTYAKKLEHATKLSSGSTKLWVAKSSCAYFNDPDKWHLHEGQSGCGKYIYPNLNKSTGCGYWQTDKIPHVRTYKVTVQKTRTIEKIVAVSNFLGQIDFNQSYFILSGIKYKLKA